MIIVSTTVGLFGPFSRVDNYGDRLRTWPPAATADAPGADLPLCVIGDFELLELDLPPGFIASDYTWNGVSLVASAPAVDVGTEGDQ